MRLLRMALVLPVFWLTLGCGGGQPEAPPELTEDVRDAIAEEDARIEELESQQP